MTPLSSTVQGASNNDLYSKTCISELMKRLYSDGKGQVVSFSVLTQLDKVFDVGPVLGHGSSGVVRLCTSKASGMKYACKSIAKSEFKSLASIEELKMELRVLEYMNCHPSAVGFHGVYEDSEVIIGFSF